jgi:NAD(P)-dependent dehydrogenase (short-subunit alcohol dehydrogenase family)
MKHLIDYTGKVAAVTGGGSGIGEACARVLADLGATVAVIDLNPEGAERVAAEIGGKAYAVDVSNQSEMEKVAKAVNADFGDVHHLAACAGITVRPRTPETFSEDVWKKIFDIDVWGVFVSAVAFSRYMPSGSSQVFISSIAGVRSLPLHAYAPAKAGVISMAQNLATEWGPRGIRVNSISPGFILTPIMKGMIERGEKDETTIVGDTAIGRLLQPEEIATALAFLGSDAASGVTGTNLPVDGGWLASVGWHTYGGLETSREQTRLADSGN